MMSTIWAARANTTATTKNAQRYSWVCISQYGQSTLQERIARKARSIISSVVLFILMPAISNANEIVHRKTGNDVKHLLIFLERKQCDMFLYSSLDLYFSGNRRAITQLMQELLVNALDFDVADKVQKEHILMTFASIALLSKNIESTDAKAFLEISMAIPFYRTLTRQSHEASICYQTIRTDRCRHIAMRAGAIMSDFQLRKFFEEFKRTNGKIICGS